MLSQRLAAQSGHWAQLITIHSRPTASLPALPLGSNPASYASACILIAALTGSNVEHDGQPDSADLLAAHTVITELSEQEGVDLDDSGTGASKENEAPEGLENINTADLVTSSASSVPAPTCREGQGLEAGVFANVIQ